MILAVDNNRHWHASLSNGEWSVIETYLDGRDPLAIEVDPLKSEMLEKMLVTLRLNIPGWPFTKNTK